MKKIKEKNKIITPIDIVYIIALALNVILYNTYSGIIIKILLFCGIMSVVMLLMYIFKYITSKEEKSKNIEKIIEINILIHFIITQILIAQRCRCGYHYFYIIPLIILLIAEVVTYHIFCVNYKKEKNTGYLIKYLLILNAIYVACIFASRVDMEKIHQTLFYI